VPKTRRRLQATIQWLFFMGYLSKNGWFSWWLNLKIKVSVMFFFRTGKMDKNRQMYHQFI
jgi:hypothetical protein